jgi:hypothetical protein
MGTIAAIVLSTVGPAAVVGLLDIGDGDGFVGRIGRRVEVVGLLYQPPVEELGLIDVDNLGGPVVVVIGFLVDFVVDIFVVVAVEGVVFVVVIIGFGVVLIVVVV